MPMLSLNEPSEAPERRVSRAEAIGASMVLHVLVLLLFMRGLDGLPEPLARWLRAHAARPPAPVAQSRPPAVPPVPTPPDAKKPEEKKPQEKKIPIPPVRLKFAYVRVPEEAELKKNPDAKRFSDRDRRARKDKAPEERQPSRDPHSIGTTRQRVIPDPRLKSGRDDPEPPKPPPAGEGPEEIARLRDQTAAEAGDKASLEKPEERKGQPRDDIASRADAGEAVPPAGTSPQSSPSARPQASRRSGAAGGAGTALSPDLREGTESKFRFENPGWISGESVDGTLSFDTKGLPWGEYARKIQVIIRQNWIDRMPLAYRQGQRGMTCQRFVIEADGTISSIDVVRPSQVPPFTRAATDALRASTPLPPLPPEFNLDREGVTGCFWYNMYPVDD